ncbi:hypothetical protein [Paenibacillus pseudetheri]|uniref:hypothetical protein n=1 Tax=Paenibacillus pseudetheri TaxID=2897682 RepID=UPI001F43473D|nr:hypothetical protein [Paenibacillus pseudetheri]
METHKEQLAPQFENIDKEAREAASRYLSEAGAHFISERDDPARAAEEAQELLFLLFYNKLISVIKVFLI